MSKTREQIITAMCYTYRHDYGLTKPAGDWLGSGMTTEQQQALWQQMAQIFDNDIAPIWSLNNELTHT
jgi:hypothetical protein